MLHIIFDPKQGSEQLSQEEIASECQRILSLNKKITISNKDLLIALSGEYNKNPEKYKQVKFSLKEHTTLLTYANPLPLVAKFFFPQTIL